MNAYDRSYLWSLLRERQWRYAFNAFRRWLNKREDR